MEKKLKKCNQFSLGKLPAGKLFCKFNTTTKRREIESRIIESLSTLRNAFFVRNFRVNMVAAIDWRSNTTHDWIWFVGFCGVQRPFETYFGLYRAVSERGKRKGKRKTNLKMTKQPPPAPTASAIGSCPTIIQISRMPRH